eukprot:TRINITY_DN2767_c0_g1_i1.p1 TRINITY_DN2767_c0_g1~~TRINITY_DN2767_c0_g1_i1.p1  ORF type:complete len:843 (+),score=152.85 TRINITY_DN2767_c0_g1_i1:619-3147(+)
MAGRLQQPAEKFGDYTTSGILGEGSFGKVYMAKSSDRRIVALKVIHLKKFSQLDEGDFATTLQHDNIVKVFDTFRCVKEQEDGEKNHYLVIVMEMFQKGWNVSWLLKQTIDDDILFQLAKDVGSALKYIHEKGYIHRDIKPDNILIDEFYHYFVSDFGLSKKAVEAGTCNGTEFYMAPEVWNRWDKRYGEGTPYGPPADMWSLGMTLFVVATGTVSDGVPLFVKYEDSQEFEKHIESELVRGNGGSIAPSIQQLIRRLLRFNPEDRITAAELVHEIASPEDQLELQPSPVDILSRNGLINEDGDDDSQQESRDSISLQTVFEKAIDLFPDSPEGYCALGHMLDPNIPDVCKHRTDLFVKAIARDPNNYFAFRSLAENAAHSPIIQGIRMSRMCLYKRVITLRPSDREARLGLAELYEDGEKVKLENSEIISKEQLQQGGGEDDADPLDCQYKLYALYCILIVSQKKSYDPMRLVEMLRAIPPLKEEELDILTPMDWNMFTIPPLNILKTPQQLCRVMNEVIPLQYSRQYLMEELLKQGDDGLPACKELMKTATGAINLQTIVDCDPPPSSEIQAFLLQQEYCCPPEWEKIVCYVRCQKKPDLKASLANAARWKELSMQIAKYCSFIVWLVASVGLGVYLSLHWYSHDDEINYIFALLLIWGMFVLTVPSYGLWVLLDKYGYLTQCCNQVCIPWVIVFVVLLFAFIALPLFLGYPHNNLSAFLLAPWVVSISLFVLYRVEGRCLSCRMCFMSCLQKLWLSYWRDKEKRLRKVSNSFPDSDSDGETESEQPEAVGARADSQETGSSSKTDDEEGSSAHFVEMESTVHPQPSDDSPLLEVRDSSS